MGKNGGWIVVFMMSSKVATVICADIKLLESSSK